MALRVKIVKGRNMFVHVVAELAMLTVESFVYSL